MKDIKNYLIAILAGLLVLTLSTRSAQSAPKQYDAVKLAEYSACLASGDNFLTAVRACKSLGYKP